MASSYQPRDPKGRHARLLNKEDWAGREAQDLTGQAPEQDTTQTMSQRIAVRAQENEGNLPAIATFTNSSAGLLRVPASPPLRREAILREQETSLLQALLRCSDSSKLVFQMG